MSAALLFDLRESPKDRRNSDKDFAFVWLIIDLHGESIFPLPDVRLALDRRTLPLHRYWSVSIHSRRHFFRLESHVQ